MLEGIPRISVRIITYKQEELIKRAINSLLAQKDYIYEICVSDDCSPDGTWEVLQQYDRDYPGLFKIHRHDKNLGIFENLEYSWTMPTGDLIYGLAGDDECGEGWFKSIIDFITNNHIDYKNELFCIYGDYLNKYPNGDTYTFSNRLITTGISPLKLALRGLIGNRGCCYNIQILRQYHKVSQGRSHIAEDAIDRQLQIFTQKTYYIPQVANIYYSYIGISSKMSEETMNERAKIRPYAISLFQSWGVKFDKIDLVYSLEFFPAFEMMVNKPTFRRVLIVIWLWFKSRDPKIKTKGIELNSFIFALRRRLPHSKPIHFK